MKYCEKNAFGIRPSVVIIFGFRFGQEFPFRCIPTQDWFGKLKWFYLLQNGLHTLLQTVRHDLRVVRIITVNRRLAIKQVGQLRDLNFNPGNDYDFLWKRSVVPLHRGFCFTGIWTRNLSVSNPFSKLLINTSHKRFNSLSVSFSSWPEPKGTVNILF